MLSPQPHLPARSSAWVLHMPIYEFECTACQAVFDRLQKLSDPDPEECPSCGQKQVRRRVTAPAFRLAGSGWYETDFKKDGEKKQNLARGDDSAGSSGKDAASAGDKGSASAPATPKPPATTG